MDNCQNCGKPLSPVLRPNWKNRQKEHKFCCKKCGVLFHNRKQLQWRRENPSKWAKICREKSYKRMWIYHIQKLDAEIDVLSKQLIQLQSRRKIELEAFNVEYGTYDYPRRDVNARSRYRAFTMRGYVGRRIGRDRAKARREESKNGNIQIQMPQVQGVQHLHDNRRVAPDNGL